MKTVVEIMGESSKRGMKNVIMTIISPRKEYLPTLGSNQRPPVIKSGMLWGLAFRIRKKQENVYFVGTKLLNFWDILANIDMNFGNIVLKGGDAYQAHIVYCHVVRKSFTRCQKDSHVQERICKGN